VGAADSSFVGYIGFQTPQSPGRVSFIRNRDWYDVLSDSVKYAFISGGLSFVADTVDDWSLLLSVGPYFIPPGDSASMYLRVFYTPTPTCPSVSNAREGDAGTSYVVIGNREIEVPVNGVRIYDVSGRLVGVFAKGKHALRRGIYFALMDGKVVRIIVP
jgi:hypothetical protein